VLGKKNAPWYSLLVSLRWRLAIVYSILFAVFVSVLSIFLYSSISALLLQNARGAFPQHVQALRTLLTQEVCDTRSTQTLTSFVQQNKANDIDVIYLLDKDGKVSQSSDGSLLGQTFTDVNVHVFTITQDNVIQAFQGRVPDGKVGDGLLLSLHAPANCLAPQLLPGYVAVLTSYSSEQDTLQNILLMLGLSSAVMIVVGALIISFFTMIMFDPLKQVTRATGELAQGDLQQRVPLAQSHDEIGELATSFNQMAGRIEQMFSAQQESERRVRRFVSDASHELRTPITSLRGFTEVLIRGAINDPATTQRVLALMKNEAERMTDLVNDLLTLAHLDEGQVSAAEDIDLIDVAVECLQKARKQAPDDCKLALELATEERLKIHVGREPFFQMLLELLANAIKYGSDGEQKKVLLRLDKKLQNTLIQVIDYGAGIVPDDIPHIFDRFYRGVNAHPSTGTPISGTGLGLSIVMAIAQAYQGAVTVCSDPGRETTFTISFPSTD
jgi:signal transduction histidine kinase